MQTFLPYPDFAQSARALDRQRLGKQRVEVLQILNALAPADTDTSTKKGWSNHPATRMWRGFQPALLTYGIAMCDEWISRGYTDTLKPRFEAQLTSPISLPPWLGDPDFHRSHQANLVRKYPDHYIPLFGPLPDLPYIWPVGVSQEECLSHPAAQP